VPARHLLLEHYENLVEVEGASLENVDTI